MDLSMHALRAVVAVAEEQHLGRAAARLHVTASSLSELVNRTEQRVGVPLFERTPRGMRTTAAGQELLPLARAVLAASDEITDWLVDRIPAQAGRIRVGLAGAAEVPLREPVTEMLRRRHPHLEVITRRRSQRAEALADLREGRLDAAYVPMLSGELEGIRRLVVARERRVLVVPVGHRLADRDRVVIEEARDEPFITIAGNDADSVSWWLIEPRTDGSRAARGPAAGDFDDLLDLVALRRGLGVAGESDERRSNRSDIAWVPLSGVADVELGLHWRTGETDRRVLAYVHMVRSIAAQTFAE